MLPAEGRRALAAPELLGLVRRLQDRRAREHSGLVHVEGLAGVLRAHAAGAQFEAVLHDPVLLQSPAGQRFVRRLRAGGVPTIRVQPEVFRSASFTARASGLAAVVRQRWSSLAAADPRRGTCWLVLERVRSPGNLGTLLRTAEAAGAGGVIFLGGACDPHHPVAVRASMGALFGLSLVRARHEELGAWSAQHGLTLLATSPGAAQVHTEAPLDPPLGLLVGDERAGLSPRALELCARAVRIPVLGLGDSLNVAVAAGVVLYEVLRRRGAAP